MCELSPLTMLGKRDFKIIWLSWNCFINGDNILQCTEWIWLNWPLLKKSSLNGHYKFEITIFYLMRNYTKNLIYVVDIIS